MTIHLPKVNEFGGGAGGGGGSASFPTMVTDSGSSLPVDLTGYNLGDTFLNTTDKKIYMVQSITKYKWGSGISLYPDSLDVYTGIATGFHSVYQNQPKICYKSISGSDYVWGGNKTYRVHFKLGENNSETQYGVFATGLGNSSTYLTKTVNFYIYNNALYYNKTKSQMGPTNVEFTEKLFDFAFEINTEYYLYVNKEGDSCSITLSNTGYNQNILISSTFTTSDYTDTATVYNIYLGGMYGYLGTESSIYLLDSFGDFLTIDTTGDDWDSGTSLTDKTEYADKTNGILYLYENEELVNIPQKNTLSFANVSASSWVSDSTYTDYGYKCELSCSGVTSSMFAQVVFAPTEADSGNYATVCLTGSGTVTIYSKVNDTITIPSIVVMGV